jgi:hypothetical protein
MRRAALHTEPAGKPSRGGGGGVSTDYALLASDGRRFNLVQRCRLMVV